MNELKEITIAQLSGNYIEIEHKRNNRNGSIHIFVFSSLLEDNKIYNQSLNQKS